MKDRQEKLFDAITLIEEDLIDDADRFREQEGEQVKLRWKARIRWRIIMILVLLAGLACVLLFGGTETKSDPAAFGEVPEFDGSGSIPVTGIGVGQSYVFAEENYNPHPYEAGKGPDLTAVKDNSEVKKLAVYHGLWPKSSDEDYQMLTAWVKDLSARAKEELGLELDYDLNKIKLFGEPYDKEHPVTDQPDPLYSLEIDLTHGDRTLNLACRTAGQVTEYYLKGGEGLYEAWSGTKPVMAGNASEQEITETARPIVDFVNRLTGTSYSMDDCRIYKDDDEVIGIYVLGWSASGSEISKKLLRQAARIQMMTIQFVRQNDAADFELNRVVMDNDYRVYQGEYELISLEEAKDLYAKGFYFPGESQACNNKLDFSSYDLVQIEYCDMLSEYVIPYYAFYKYLGQKQYDPSEGLFPETDGLADEYAVIYVPAVEVELQKDP